MLATLLITTTALLFAIALGLLLGFLLGSRLPQPPGEERRTR